MMECHNMAILTHCETVYIAQICCLSLFFFSIVEFAVIGKLPTAGERAIDS